MFVGKRYDYSKYQNSEKSKIQQLNEEYLNLYIKFINKKELSPDESEAFKDSIDIISEYITGSVLTLISRGSEKPIEKKLIMYYNKYSYMYEDIAVFSFKISEDLLDISRESIYSALGVGEVQDKAFKKKGTNPNIISYIYNIYFYKVLNYLESEVRSFSEFEIEGEAPEKDISEILEIEELLEKKKIKIAFGETKYEEILEIMVSGSQNIPKDLIEIFKYINN